jgi:hypothetical protein
MVGKTPDSELDMIMALDMKIPAVDEVGIINLGQIRLLRKN